MSALGFDKNMKNDYIPQHVIVKGTSQFINKNNFNLFVETTTTPQKENKVHSCHEDLPPELPQRGYLEEGDDLNKIPDLPPRRYTEDDIGDFHISPGGIIPKPPMDQYEHKLSSNSPVNTSGLTINPTGLTHSHKQGTNDNETNDNVTVTCERTEMGQIIKKFKKSKDSPAKEDNSSLGDYTPLDFSTLDQRQAQRSGQQDEYMTLTKPGQKATRPQIKQEPGYMSLDSKKDSDKEIENSYECIDLNIRRARPKVSGNSDESPYMPLTATTMTRETAGLVRAANLKKASNPAKVSNQSSSSDSTNTDGPYMILSHSDKVI